MKLKLCGIRRAEDIEMMNEAMPDYIGFVFAPSRRRISPQTAIELSRGLDSKIKKVGVFVNEAPNLLLEAARIAALDVVQLHGDEDENYIKAVRKGFCGEIWKAVRVSSPMAVKQAETLDVDMLLYDSFLAGQYGGTGRPADLSAIIAANPKRPFFLAGGLNKDNLSETLATVIPFGIDLSGGFETDGVKDRSKLFEILDILKGRNNDE